VAYVDEALVAGVGCLLEDATRDRYEVDEEPMADLRRILQMIGAEGCTLYRARRILEKAGVLACCGEDWIGCES
jgi:hypothetical protein